ncbi:DUF3638 domain-containing protein, partial [Simkania negevensis]|nr:DUF3638 domain-containing protein [Simkania negevensis]
MDPTEAAKIRGKEQAEGGRGATAAAAATSQQARSERIAQAVQEILRDLAVNQFIPDAANNELKDLTAEELQDHSLISTNLSPPKDIDNAQWNQLVKRFAHVHSDTLIKATSLEGNRFPDSLEYMLELLEAIFSSKALILEPDEIASMKAPIEQLHRSFTQMQQMSKELEQLVDRKSSRENVLNNLHAKAFEITKALYRLRVGETYSIPGGWAGSPGHAMVYTFTKCSGDRYDIEIYNTGAGTKEYHNILEDGLKSKISPLIRYEGVTYEEIFFSQDEADIQSDWILALLEPQVLTRLNRALSVKPADIYRRCFGHLESKRLLSNQSTIGYMTAQRGGSCSWRVLTAMLFATIREKRLYKLLHLEIRLQSFITFYQASKEMLQMETPQVEQTRTLLKNAAEKLIRMSAKRYSPGKEGTLPREKTVKAYATAVEVLNKIAAIERGIQERRSSEVALSVTMQPQDIDLSPLKNSIGTLRTNHLRRPQEGRNEIATDGYHNLQPPTPDTLLATLTRAEEVVRNALSKQQETTAHVVLEELLSLLPVPTTNEADFWQRIPQGDLNQCISSFDTLLGHYAALSMTSAIASPKVKNNCCFGYAISHVLAVRIDSTRQRGPREPRLIDYRVQYYPRLRNCYKVFYCSNDWKKQQMVNDYFNSVNKRAKETNKRSLLSFFPIGQRGCLNPNENIDCHFFDTLRKNNHAVNEAVQTQNKFYSQWQQSNRQKPPLSADEMMAFELTWDIGDEPAKSPLLASGFGHLVYLKRAALYLEFNYNNNRNGERNHKFTVILAPSIYDTTTLTATCIYGSQYLLISVETDKKMHPPLQETSDFDKAVRHIIEEEGPVYFSNNNGAIGSPSSHDRDSLPDESAILINKKNTLLLPIRELIRTGTQPRLFTYQLLYYFRHNRGELAKIAIQTLFDTIFFKPIKMNDNSWHLPLFDQLATEPNLVEQCIDLLNSGIRDFWEKQPGQKPNVSACLFFVRLADRIRNLAPQEKSDQILHNENELLERWLALPNLSLQEKSAIHLHRIYHFYQKTKISPLSSPELLSAYQSWIFYLNNNMNDPSDSPILKAAAQTFAYTMSPQLLKLLEEPERRNTFFDTLFKIFSLPPKSDQQQWQPKPNHPTYHLETSSSTFWAVNIETGEICNEAGVLKNTQKPKWKDDSAYKRLFEEEDFTFHASGNSHYFNSPRLGPMRMITQAPDDTLSQGLQMERNGIWYQYIAPTSFCQNPYHKNLLKEIPHFLKADHAFWLSSDQDKPSLITDLKTGKTLYLVYSDGRIIPAEDERKTRQEQRCLYLHQQRFYNSNDDPDPLAHFECNNYTAIWLKGEGRDARVAAIIFPRYLSSNERTLAFVTSTNGQAVWASNQQYQLSASQKRWLFGNMHNYLLLESREGKGQKLLLPLQKFHKLSAEEELTSYGTLDIEERERSTEWLEDDEFDLPQQGQYRFLEYDLVNDKPRAKDTEGSLFLAYLYLGQRNYTEALTCLRTVTQSDLLSLQSQEILEWIFLLGQRNKDFSANAATLRLHAYKMLADHKKRPEFEKKKEEQESKKAKEAKEAKEKAITRTIHADYTCYLDGLQNVDVSLRLSKEEEVELIESVLEVTAFARRHYDLTHNTPKKPTAFANQHPPLPSFTQPHHLAHLGPEYTALPPDKSRFRGDCEEQPCPALAHHETESYQYRNYLKAFSFENRYGRPRPPIKHLSILFVQEGLQLSNDFVSLYEVAAKGSKAQKKALLFRLSQIDTENLQQKHAYLDWVLYNYLIFALQHPRRPPAYPVANNPTEGELYNFHRTLNIAYSNAQQRQPEPAVSQASPAQQPQQIEIDNLHATFPLIAAQPAARYITPTTPASLRFPGATNSFERSYPLPSEWLNNDKHEECKGSAEIALGPQEISDTEAEYSDAIRKEFAAFAEELRTGQQQNASLPHYSLKEGKEFKAFESEMSVKINEQEERLEAQEKVILALANRKSQDSSHALRESMLLRGRSNKKLNLNDLILLFLKGREELFYAANTNLDEQEIKNLHQLIGKYLVNATHLQQWRRGCVHVGKLVANGLGNSEEQRYLIEQLGYELFAKKAYGNSNTPLDPEREIPFLVFEYFSDMRIRPEQYELLQKMTETGNGKRYSDIVIQLIMGGGKTSVLASILGHLAAKPGRLALFVTPASQFYTVRENLKKAQRKHFHQEIDSIDLSRNAFTLQNLQWVHNKLKNAMEREEMVVVKSETLQALELEFLSSAQEYINNAGKAPPEELMHKIATLRDILLIFRNNSDATIDEVDLVLNALREVNFPIGEAERVKSERVDVVKTIMGLLASKEAIPGTNQTMEELTGIKRNEQAQLSQEEYRKKVEPFLANRLAETYAPFAVKQEQRSSLIRYLRNEISSQAQILADYSNDRTVPTEHRQEVEKARRWYETQQNRSKIDDDITFLRELARRANSANAKESEPANLIALAKHVIQTLLPATLGKSCGRHFGRSKNIENAGEVLPYQGVDTPSTTKFGYHYESIIYHYLTALSQGLSPYQVIDLANKFKTAALLYDEPFNETAEAEEFKELTGVALAEIDNPGKVDEAVANINKETNKLLDAETETIAHYVSFYTHRFTSTPQSLIDQINSCRAMSGTPWNAPGYRESLANNTLPDEGTEGRIVDTMLRRAEKLKEENVHVVNSSNAKELLTEALANHPLKEQFYGIIDVGGHFKGINNTQVAREILDYFENDERIEAVLFYLPPAGPGASSSEKKNAGKLAIMKKGAPSYEVIGGTSKELIEGSGVPLNKLFVYYDESHTTGSDIKQCPTSKNFVTVDERLLRRNFFQGILRLREFFYFQDVEYIVPEGVQGSLINGGKTVLDLIKSSIKFQAIRLAMDTYRSFKQQINNIIRKKALERLLNLRMAADPSFKNIASTISEEFKKYQKVLLSTSSDSPYTQFGRVEKSVDTIDNLRRHIKIALENFPTDQQETINELETELNCLIDRAKRCGALPAEVKEPAADIIGLEEEVELQIEQEVEQEVEQELEQELQQELQSYLNVQPQSAIEEKGWIQMPSIQELIRPNNNPDYTQTTSSSRPKIFSLKQILGKLPSNALFKYERKYHDIFDDNILLTNNFRLTGTMPHPVFSQYQKPGNQILAVEHEGKIFFILLSSYDAEKWKEWLKGSQTDDARHIWLIQPDGTSLQDNRYNTPLSREQHDKAISRALLQINLFNGNMHYLNIHTEEVDRWLNESHPETKLRYLKLKVEKDPVQKQLFNNSPIMQPEKYRKMMQKRIVHLRRQEKLANDQDIIRNYSPEEIAVMNPSYVHLLTKEQVKHLTTAEQILKLTVEQAKHITPVQVPHLHRAYLNVFEKPEQIRAIPIDKVGMINNENYFQYFSLEQARQMTEQQQPFFGKLPVTVASSLIKENEPAEQKKRVACLSKEQIPFIDDPEIIQMFTESQLDDLSPSQVKHLANDQIKRLKKAELIKTIDDPTKIKLVNAAYADFVNANIVPHLTDEQTKKIRQPKLVANITQPQLPYLDDSVIKYIDAVLVKHLANDKVSLLGTKEQVTAVENTERIQKINNTAVHYLTGLQVAHVRPEQVPYLIKEEIKYLQTSAQIQAIPNRMVKYVTAGQANDLKKEQIPYLETSEQIQALSGRALIQAIPKEMVKHVTAGQVNDLTAEQSPYLETREQIQSLTAAQINSGLRIDQLPMLSDTQIGYLQRVDLVRAIKSERIMHRISDASVAHLLPEQVALLSDAQLSFLNNGEQIAALDDEKLHLISDKAIVHVKAERKQHLAAEQKTLFYEIEGRKQAEERIEPLIPAEQGRAEVASPHPLHSKTPLAAIGKQFSTIAPNPDSIIDKIIAIAKKIFVVLALVILSPLWAITFLVSKIYNAIVVDSNVTAIADKAKDAFEKRWCQAMANEAAATDNAALAVEEAYFSLSDKEGTQILREKTRRLLWRIVAVEGFQDIYHERTSGAIEICMRELTKENPKALTRTQVRNALTTLATALKTTPETEGSVDHLLNQIESHTRELHTRLQKELKATQHSQKAAEAINSAVSGLHDQLQSQPKESDLAAANRKTVVLLEEVLQSDSYLFLRESALPAIAFIHNVCLAMHTKSHAGEEVRRVGQGLLAEVDKKRKGTQEIHDEWIDLAQDVEESYNLTRKHFADASGVVKKVTYAIQRPMKALSALKSVEAIPGSYDPYASDNYPTTLGETTYGPHAKVCSLYAPTPTVDANVRPLYKGLLQAVENNAFLGAKAPQGATKFIFEINYQQMQGAEGKRTRNIMKNVMEHPFSLDVMTLPLDTDFYQGKVAKWKNADSFFDQFKQHIFGKDGKACRRIEDKRCGYFFTSRVSNDEIEWTLDATRQLFKKIEENGRDEWEKLAGQQKQRLFQDVFHLLIRLQSEQKYAHRSHNVLNYSHCKMHVDRGAMMTLLYSLAIRAAMPNNEVDDYDSLRSFACGALSTRALTIDKRSIMQNYAEETTAFLRHIPQDALGNTIRSLIGEASP